MAKKHLGDICNVVTGSTPKTNVDEYWDGDIKWITPAELTEDTYILEDSVRKITGLAVQKTGLSPFPKGTVILSSRAPIGKVAIAGCEMYCNQGFKNLICTDEIYNKYLYWFLKSKTEFLIRENRCGDRYDTPFGPQAGACLPAHSPLLSGGHVRHRASDRDRAGLASGRLSGHFPLCRR